MKQNTGINGPLKRGGCDKIVVDIYRNILYNRIITKRGHMERTEERRNRFTGERAFLTVQEADIHDKVFYHEALEQWGKMQKCLDKFSRLNPKAYMVLLD